MTSEEDAFYSFEPAATVALEGELLERALSLARAWCRAQHLDEAASVLRPLAPDLASPSDPSALRDLLGLQPWAPISHALEALAASSQSPAVVARLSLAAQIAWDAALP